MTLDARTKELARTALAALQDVKGKNIVGLDLSEIESYTDFVLIASGSSDRQTVALADNVIRKMFELHRLHPLGTEGYSQGEWVLIDFGALVVHVFFEDVRKQYHLEDMWLNVSPVSESGLESLLSGRVEKKPAAKGARKSVAKTAASKKPAKPAKAAKPVKASKTTPSAKSVKSPARLRKAR